MGVLAKTLVPAKQAENTQQTQYTASSCRAIIDAFTACNTTASNATISVNLVSSGGSASDSNLLVDAMTIAPGETRSLSSLIGQVLEPSAFISTIAGTASAITIMISGREVT